MNDENEKRQHLRHEFIWNIYYISGQGLRSIGYLKNFSLNGILFASKIKFKENELIKIKITIPGTLFSEVKLIYLEVPVRIKREIKTSNALYTFDYGAEFEVSCNELLTNIGQFLKYWKEKQI